MANPYDTMPHINNVVHHLPAMKPVIIQGYTFMELLISNAVTAAVAGGLAWYIRGRGLTGVQIDISNIKNDIENIKSKISPTPNPVVTPVVVTPAVAA